MDLSYDNLKELAKLGASIHIHMNGAATQAPSPSNPIQVEIPSPAPSPAPAPEPPPAPSPQPNSEPAEKIKYARVSVTRTPHASPFKQTGADGHGKPILVQPKPHERPYIPYGIVLVVDLEYTASEWDNRIPIEGGIWSASLGQKYPVYKISSGAGNISGHPGDYNLSGWFIRCDQVKVISTFEQ